jgi:hypothetical protein
LANLGHHIDKSTVRHILRGSGKEQDCLSNWNVLCSCGSCWFAGRNLRMDCTHEAATYGASHRAQEGRDCR